MTKCSTIVTLLSVCAMVVAYQDMDDSLKVEDLVKDKPSLQQYMDCYLDRQIEKTCTPQILAYKSHLQEAVTDGCKECNDVERHMLKVFILALKRTVTKKDFEDFKVKYDPNNHIETTFAQVARF